MAGSVEGESREDLFVWDETARLYLHSRSGFYHDPAAGWYYSTKDGLYYKFDNGRYVLWDCQQGIVPFFDQGRESGPGLVCAVEVASQDPIVESSCPNGGQDNNLNSTSAGEDEFSADAYALDNRDDAGGSTLYSDQAPGMPPPASEWLEETLINTYLSGCSPIDVSDGSVKQLPISTENVSPKENEDANQLKPVELIKEGCVGSIDQTINIEDEDLSQDERSWRAQYGQAVHSWENPRSELLTVDLWDWSVVKFTSKGGKDVIARLVGRLTKPATKLHPSMPSNGSLFKSAPICEVHLDLVRVRTGQVYKLHSPSARYLASLSSYDSSNPTKDWGFPEFSLADNIGKTMLKPSAGDSVHEGTAIFANNELPQFDLKMKSNVYRDRAAERRKLHGSSGFGPGQKNLQVSGISGMESPVSTSSEHAAAEAMNASFGAGSYAQKILTSMGWKEGEALGSSTKGLIEPLQVTGNIGNAGLGWPQIRQRHK